MFACFLSHSLICLSTWSSQVKYESGGIKAERERKKVLVRRKKKSVRERGRKRGEKPVPVTYLSKVSANIVLSLSLSDLQV